MANLCVASCHSVNGVSKLHSEILKDTLFNDYYRANDPKNSPTSPTVLPIPSLALPVQSRSLPPLFPSTSATDLYTARRKAQGMLCKYADDNIEVLGIAAKRSSVTTRLAFGNYVKEQYGVSLDPDSLFDMQVKRLHEYKRQHLNALHIISDYLYLKDKSQRRIYAQDLYFRRQGGTGLLSRQADHSDDTGFGQGYRQRSGGKG